MATGLFALALSPMALAQGSFVGSWKVVEVVKADWIEPTAQPQEAALAIGDTVEFTEAKVVAIAALGCEKAEYKLTRPSQADLFQRSIGPMDSAAKIAERFNIGTNPNSLVVDCDSGKVFEYYEARKGRVVTLFDSLVYTLERISINR